MRIQLNSSFESSEPAKAGHRNRLAVLKHAIFSLGCFATLGFVSGCKDGPMYAMKSVNPYFVYGDWKRDAEIGVTDHERREQLSQLVDTMDSLPDDRQAVWAGQLEQLLKNDQSPEMRRLAVRAAGGIRSDKSIDLVEMGLDDDSTKVRMEACRVLASKQTDNAARILASTIGTETNEDVRHSAIAALSEFKNPIATDALRMALRERNPATQSLAIKSLRGVTGKDLGDDPQVWIASLDGGLKSQGVDGGTRVAESDSTKLR